MTLFLERILQGSSLYRVIMCCNYGSPSSQHVEYDIGTPTVLSSAARISPMPVEVWSIVAAVWVSKSRVTFRTPTDLLSLVFNWTLDMYCCV